MSSAATTIRAAEPGHAVPASAVDVGAFRRAMGSFPTGVTVVTVASGDGDMHGITVNSFSSVSLDPMLVLVCLNEASRGVGLIERAGAFVVNVLSAGQQGISRWFANRYRPADSAMFHRVPFEPGATGCPVLVDAAASFDCRLRHSHRAGDHLIMLGEVVALVHRPQLEPLIFHAGRYKWLEHEPCLRPGQAGHGDQQQPARNRHPDHPTIGARRPVKGRARKPAASQPTPDPSGRRPLVGH
jgi:flavin reductase